MNTLPTLFNQPDEQPQRSLRTHPAKHLASQTNHFRATWCKTCRAPLLAGLDDELCAFPIEVDPSPLSPIGEALALLAGRRTVSCIARGTRPRLKRRIARTIAYQPAGSFPGDVLAEHRCGAAPLPSIDTAFPETPEMRFDPDAPPPF